MTEPSIPCLVCGKELQRVFELFSQPNDGIMGMSYGNYGSTVFDPMDYSYLEFNICDECIVEAAAKGRVYKTRGHRLVQAGHLIVGVQKADRPSVPWVPEEHEEDVLQITNLDDVPDDVQLSVPAEYLEEHLKENP